jgi:hypothetical protein
LLPNSENIKKLLTELREVFIGIDPGASGAIAIITQSCKIIGLHDWPGNEKGAADLIANIKDNCKFYGYPLYAALEKVHSMPGQGVSSTFKFGTNYGIWLGILSYAEIPFRLVTPQAWQKGVIAKAQDKQPCIDAACRLFPNAELWGPRGGKKDGRADALLIADWCRREFGGKKTRTK